MLIDDELARWSARKTGSTLPSDALEHFRVRRIRFTLENAPKTKARADFSL